MELKNQVDITQLALEDPQLLDILSLLYGGRSIVNCAGLYNALLRDSLPYLVRMSSTVLWPRVDSWS